MIGILFYVLVFYAGLMIGFLLRSWVSYRFRDYSGTIYVNRDEFSEKTVYSLVLDDYPEKLEFKKIVVFKVDAPEKKA